LSIFVEKEKIQLLTFHKITSLAFGTPFFVVFLENIFMIELFAANFLAKAWKHYGI